MKKNILHILFLLFFSFLPLQISATETESEHPSDIALRLQQNYDQIQNISFHFHQDTFSTFGGRPQKGSGEAFFLRNSSNGKMRWNYFSPDHQVLLSDGETFSMYFSKLNQMIVSSAEAMASDITYSFFTGKGSLTDDFFVFAPDESVGVNTADADINIIKLVPKESQSQVQFIHIWVTADSLIQRIEITDHFDTLTVLNFSRIILDSLSQAPEQLAAIFSFTPPEGTEVIYQ